MIIWCLTTVHFQKYDINHSFCSNSKTPLFWDGTLLQGLASQENQEGQAIITSSKTFWITVCFPNPSQRYWIWVVDLWMPFTFFNTWNSKALLCAKGHCPARIEKRPSLLKQNWKHIIFHFRVEHLHLSSLKWLEYQTCSLDKGVHILLAILWISTSQNIQWIHSALPMTCHYQHVYQAFQHQHLLVDFWNQLH